MNSINLAGRLVKKPELEFTKGEKKSIVRFSIAVNSGNDNADFFNVTAFDKMAENLCKYCDKGDMVAISGKLTTSTYEKQDGSKGYSTNILANSITFCNSKEK